MPEDYDLITTFPVAILVFCLWAIGGVAVAVLL